MIRKIIEIDAQKCNGCGQCVNACAEGAIQLVDGKAKLVSDVYCDGLGACIGECPVDALKIIEREAVEFDQNEVDKFLTKQKASPCATGGCPGSMPRNLSHQPASSPAHSLETAQQSSLANWPIQLTLVPVNASYLKHASLLVAADCTAFAFPGFNQRFMKGKVSLIGCPKLDDSDSYRKKLAQIITANEIEFIHVVYMEVPCCGGLVRLVQSAVIDSGVKVPLRLTKIGINGNILDETVI